MIENEVGKPHFNPDTRMVSDHNGLETILRPQSAMVLAELTNFPGKTLTKDSLIRAVWGNIAVTDGSLVQCIAEIRRALHDEDRHIVQTVPKLGYRIAESGLLLTITDATLSAPALTFLQQQPIRFATASDGMRLAWTASGKGTPMLKAPSWVSNIEMEAQSQLFAPFYEQLGNLIRLIRFDQRGTSLSGRYTKPLTIDAMVEDMRSVADAAGLDRFFIYGPSQGVAFGIAFAHRYPERVIGIIGRGGFAQGWLAQRSEEGRTKYEVSKALIEAGWHADNPEFRRFFTARLLPDADPVISREFDEMQKRTVDPATMLANLELMCRLDIQKIAKQVHHPTLLVHSKGDRAIAVTEGSNLTTLMPNAEFVPVDGDNHIFIPGTKGSQQALLAIEHFLREQTLKLDNLPACE